MVPPDIYKAEKDGSTGDIDAGNARESTTQSPLPRPFSTTICRIEARLGFREPNPRPLHRVCRAASFLQEAHQAGGVMARVSGYRTSWEMAGEAARKYHDTNWRIYQEGFFETAFNDWWEREFANSGKPRAVFDLSFATREPPKPIKRWSVWRLLGDNKPHAFRNLPEQSEPPWNDIAAVGIEDWGRGAIDHVKAYIGLSESDAGDWVQEKKPLGWAAEGAKLTERRGPKPKYEWPDFWCEVAMIADGPDGLPEKQADLETIMLAWCAETWGREPGVSTVRQRLSKLYRYKEVRRPTI